MRDQLARLTAALSDRYAIERELGSGGMANVYLARDLKHDRDVAIKVLRPELTAALGADRFLKEIAIAARFTHPNILPLHDSGEVDEFLFYVMPYVVGETLRDRLDREHQLPLEDAIEIAREVARALAYAHSHDVIHRDIKPENILLSSGQAVVADFGIARAINMAGDTAITGAGLTLGTAAYMSPEQASGSDELDGRSDIYSLGCVLYEMLTGETPYTGPSAHAIMARQLSEPVRRISVVRETVPDQVEQIVMQCLAKLPADRFATAAQLDDTLERLLRGDFSLSQAARMVPERKKRWFRVGAPAAAILAIALFFIVRSGQGVGFSERDWILIADLQNDTGDSVFERSLNTALTVAVDQSQYVNVYPRNRVYETLQRMERDSVTQIDEALAIEIALRENIKAVLAFSLSNIDSTYVVTTRVLDPTTGVAVVSRDAQVTGKSKVLEALDDLARTLRRDLGESLGAIEERGMPLPLATTPSLDALKLHADGNAAWSASQWEEARSLWQKAVALDSNFAWAHASLGLATSWLDGSQVGQPHYDTALSLLDRVTEKERLWITSLSTNGEESSRALRVYLQQYPDDRDAWYNLGNGLRQQRRQEEALEAYNRAIVIDSLSPWPYVNSAMVQDGLAQFTESGAAWAKAIELDPSLETQAQGDLNRNSGFVLVKLGDTAAARVRFEKMLSASPGQRANGHRSLGLLEMYRGRYQAGIDQLQEAVLLNQTQNASLSEYRNRLYLASAYRAKGMTGEQDRQIAAAEQLVERMGYVGTSWLANLAREYATHGAVADARRVLETVVAREETGDFNRGATQFMTGLVSLAAGDVEGALEPLELSQRLWASDLTLDAIGRASLATGDLDRAERAFLDILEHKPLGWEGQEAWFNAHYYLGQVYEAKGDTDRAASYYAQLVDLWEGADDDLVLLADTRARLARLAGEPNS